ncbi:hypothetical protein [Rhodococcus sp. NPDC056516]|uniref:hypothetical protein n=1 Tax=Rhodococcus sp. NPDC056516 TaxID=3345847 RepID=UPI00366EA8C3
MKNSIKLGILAIAIALVSAGCSSGEVPGEDGVGRENEATGSSPTTISATSTSRSSALVAGVPDMSSMSGPLLVTCLKDGKSQPQGYIAKESKSVTLTVVDPKTGKGDIARQFDLPPDFETPRSCGYDQRGRKYFDAGYSLIAVEFKEKETKEPHVGFVDAATGVVTDVSRWLAGAGNFAAKIDHSVPMFDASDNLVFWDGVNNAWISVDLKTKGVVGKVSENSMGYQNHPVFLSMPDGLPCKPIWKIDSTRFLVHFTGGEGKQDSIALWTSDTPLTDDDEGRQAAEEIKWGDIPEELRLSSNLTLVAATLCAELNPVRLTPLMDSGSISNAVVSPDLKAGVITVSGARSGGSRYSLDASNPDNLNPIADNFDGKYAFIDWI